MESIGFLHTSPVHVPTFDGLVAHLAPGTQSLSTVDESLLELARRIGVDDDEVAAGVERAVVDLIDRGAAVVVCTCSTIGGLAEAVGHRRHLEVVRVDRPMADLAVTIGDRISVVAAVESTIEPTTALLESSAAMAGVSPTIAVHLVAGAWERFEAGDRDGYLNVIAEALPALASGADVIVLAQASMADAAGLVDIAVPVLSSPRIAIESLLVR